MTDDLRTQAAAIWARAQARAEADDTSHHFTNAEEAEIDRHVNACEGCRRCRRNQP